MTKSIYTLGVSFWVFVLFKGFRIAFTADLYASFGEDVLIESPHTEVQEWQFPERNEILADCTNGNFDINFRLNRSSRLNITENCSLLIHNFTKDDVGLYICFRFGKENSTKHTYEIKIKLRKLQIDEANDANLVQGTEGKMITLTCTLNGGSSNDILNWIKDNTTIVSGKSPSLRYTFMAGPSDDMKEFICKGTNKKSSYILIKEVVVVLYLKPTVFITVLSNSSVAKIEKNVIVRNGQHIELKCTEKYNSSGDIVIFSWLFNWIVLRNNTNMLVLSNINHKTAGEYICSAHNTAGVYYDAVNISVADRPEMPRKFKVFALNVEMLIKWQAGNSGGRLQTFLVEYRSRFELEWSLVSAESKTSIVIDGLQMDTVYFVRMFSRNIVGDSNTTDYVIVKTGKQHLVIQSYSWEIGVIGSAAVVCSFCLCGIIATSKRFCLNMGQMRSNRSPGNETTHETHQAQYDEIYNVYYNPNVIPESSVDSPELEAVPSLGNGRNIDNIGSENASHEIVESGTDSNILRVDNVSTSSDDSYLVPCRKYINLEIGFTGESHQIREPENLGDDLSASNSASSETHIKSDHKYETLDIVNIDEHSYESTIET